jgi:hypothetical protein
MMLAISLRAFDGEWQMARKSKLDTVSFRCSEADSKVIRAIARRARELYLANKVDRDLQDIEMDVTATHCNGNPLRLADLLAADDFNFMHDVSKIARHLDRETGKLTDCFSPRFSLRAPSEAA